MPLSLLPAIAKGDTLYYNVAHAIKSRPQPAELLPQFGRIPELERGEPATAELLARHLPKSHVIKTLNSILVEEIVPDARPSGAKDRRALPVAGNDLRARKTASVMALEPW
ncbi:hypothetical protein [Parapusillimonas granuli]|uniref:Uncharacterized protein n=1 Tax=Parapusillimonas granuli TaxID=380911 RepID=A0A853GAP1_9BURK|nr:hypothetical protein [Parapusillimonas granuli]MBB5216852.1 hypothetical protein [Parapusillimonas granuli]NYT51651.1 hypothetical protein [Parapusillimonas granuli]